MKFPTLGCLLVVFGLSSLATAGEFESPAGYSLVHPDDWVVATKSNLDLIKAEVGDVFKDMKVDMSQIDSFIFKPTDELAFVANVNVVVTTGRLPLTEEGKKEYEQAMKKMVRQVGGRISDFAAEIETHAGIETISATYTMNLPGVEVPVRQWQVAFPKGGKVFMVTCSATPQQYPTLEPEFQQIIASFTVGTGLLGMFNSLPAILRYAIVGGVIGGLVGLVSSTFKKQSAAKKHDMAGVA